jgi:hypothetical protein
MGLLALSKTMEANFLLPDLNQESGLALYYSQHCSLQHTGTALDLYNP